MMLSSMAKATRIGRILCLLCIVFATYFRGLFGGYTFDDFPNIVDNTQLHVSTLSWSSWWGAIFSSPSSELQRPLAMFTFAVNHYLSGLAPFPIKLTNLAVHLLNTILAYWFASCVFRVWSRRFRTDSTPGRREAAALMLTALWALAPVNLTPVLLAVQRMESLAQVFVFLGLALYISGRERQLDGRPGGVRIISGVVFCTAIGLLAKETAVAIPLYAAMIEWLLFGFANEHGRVDRRLLLFYTMVLILPFVMGCLWVIPWALSPESYANRAFTLPERLLTESRVLWDYVQWTVIPNLNALSLYHDDYVVSHSLLDPPSTAVAILGLAATFALGVAVRKKRPLTSLGVLLFFSAHALTGTIIPLELVYEHRNYFASFVVLLILVDVLVLKPWSPRIDRAGAYALFGLMVFFAFITFLRASEWGNPARFALSEASKHPLSPRATYDEGLTYVILSEYDVKSRFFPLAEHALVFAMRVPNSNVLPEQALLILAARTNTPQQDEWWESMQHKLESRPIGAQEISALYSLSKCQAEGHCSFETERMLETFYSALGSGKPRPDVLTIYANYAVNVLHDYDLALRLMLDATEQSPGNIQYHENLAKVLIFLGRFDEAKSQITQMRRLDRIGTAIDRIHAIEQRLEAARTTPAVQPN